jgi:hypothetical protein
MKKGRDVRYNYPFQEIAGNCHVVAEKKVVYADKEVSDLLDLLIEYWNITEGCDCTELMTVREEQKYYQIKYSIQKTLKENP